jgi:hypothetical protein
MKESTKGCIWNSLTILFVAGLVWLAECSPSYGQSCAGGSCGSGGGSTATFQQGAFRQTGPSYDARPIQKIQLETGGPIVDAYVNLDGSFNTFDGQRWVLKSSVAAAKATCDLCGCGCVETGKCLCKNCNEHTADPNWVPPAKKIGALPSDESKRIAALEADVASLKKLMVVMSASQDELKEALKANTEAIKKATFNPFVTANK